VNRRFDKKALGHPQKTTGCFEDAARFAFQGAKHAFFNGKLPKKLELFKN
jgi:hypothetical protein